jgi:hypothetical protein
MTLAPAARRLAVLLRSRRRAPRQAPQPLAERDTWSRRLHQLDCPNPDAETWDRDGSVYYASCSACGAQMILTD